MKRASLYAEAMPCQDCVLRRAVCRCPLPSQRARAQKQCLLRGSKSESRNWNPSAHWQKSITATVSCRKWGAVSSGCVIWVAECSLFIKAHVLTLGRGHLQDSIFIFPIKLRKPLVKSLDIDFSVRSFLYDLVLLSFTCLCDKYLNIQERKLRKEIVYSN